MAFTEVGHEARFLLGISGIQSETLVIDLTVHERTSAPFHCSISLACEDEIKFDDVVGKEALVTIQGDDEERYLHGIVSEFQQAGGKGRFHIYRARIIPSLWLLSLEQDCRIFQNKTVQDIVTQILKDGGMTSDRFDFRLQGQYPPREYCVQYRETDLQFISRLLEEEGIYYFFEHSKQKHVVVFADSTAAYKPIPGKADVPINPAGGMVPEGEFVFGFAFSRRILSGKMTQKDFNFEKPSLDLTVQEQASSHQKLEIYDYPGKYADQSRGKKLTQVRLQEVMAFRDKAEGQSACPRFTPGFTFKLTGHDWKAFDQEYILVDVLHTGSQPQSLQEEGGSGGGASYSNDFLCIPSSSTLKPERISPKPVVEGVQTAIVVGPQGEEIYCDEHGRVKVQFHWDREGKQNEKSSCWIRVSQTWAGAGWGAMHIPRIGQEVVVSFIEGDPDRPIVTGRVYHGANKPPYTLPDEKTKSTLKSDSSIGGGGSNEIRFEDKKGSEEIYLHGQKDWKIVIENDKNQNVGNNETLSIGKNRSKTVGKDESESIGENKSISVGKNHNESIGSSATISVGENESVSIGKNQSVSVGANQSVSVGDNQDLSVGKDLTSSIGSKASFQVGKNADGQIGDHAGLDVGKKLSINAGDQITIVSDRQITLQAGSAKMILKKSGDIVISGAKINLKATGDIVMKGSNIKTN